ncbi:DUF397 domain-containing protein [Streptomyces sp. NPDC007808]|uniref:DUF397 domain-containing protein n=1 Tax=Streptomyces sp. NPDC007808 TaxID=3364779 RepID=UPI0036C21ECA
MSTAELAWFKSSYSGGSGDDCVEVALTPATVHVRDSKAPNARRMALSPESWHAFVSHCTTIRNAMSA